MAHPLIARAAITGPVRRPSPHQRNGLLIQLATATGVACGQSVSYRTWDNADGSGRAKANPMTPRRRFVTAIHLLAKRMDPRVKPAGDEENEATCCRSHSP